MAILPDQPDGWDYFAVIVCAIMGIAWGWVLASCWIAHLKDTKKRKEG